MAGERKTSFTTSMLLRMHPLHRIAISAILTLITFIVFPKSDNALLLGITLWDVFSVSYVITSWIVLFKRSVPEIRRTASKDDGSKVVVFVLIIISSFASMLTVLLLILSKDAREEMAFLPAVIVGMLLAWIMVHTVFSFHYAHMFYADEKNKRKTTGGLDFPGEKEPDYIDFAYFAFVIGCTFQVSDVTITSRHVRRLVLLHGLLSFALNTFVVALTINLIAGLGNS